MFLYLCICINYFQTAFLVMPKSTIVWNLMKGYWELTLNDAYVNTLCDKQQTIKYKQARHNKLTQINCTYFSLEVDFYCC